MKFILPAWLIISLLFTVACDSQKQPSVDPYAVVVTGGSGLEGARFTVRREGEFNAGFENNKRELLLVVDSKTGKEYLAITDCSVIELVSKERREKAEQAAQQAAESIAEACD